jgi:hypothetical protein
VGTSPLPEVHYNSQNTQKKFGGNLVARNSNRISRGNGTIAGRITRQAKIIIKEKSLKKTTLKFVKGVAITTTISGGATFPGIWLSYTRNLLVSKFNGTSLKLTSLLDLLTPVAPKIFLRNTTIGRSHRSWTIYSALTICS